MTHQGNPVEYYSLIKMNKIVSLFERWMDLESVIQRWKSEREKQRLKIICGIEKNGTGDPICKAEIKTVI